VSIEDAIGFAHWIVGRRRRRPRAEDRSASWAAPGIGLPAIGRPAAGPTNPRGRDPVLTVAERYGDCASWANRGHHAARARGIENMSRSRGGAGGTRSGHRNASVLPDVYHLYKGGRSHRHQAARPDDGRIFHMTTTGTSRFEIRDRHRFPGDRVAPLVPLLRDLRRSASRMLSLELFNPETTRRPAGGRKTGAS